MKTPEQKLIEEIERVGHLEGSPVHLIDKAVLYGRTLLFHVRPSRRATPDQAIAAATQWLIAKTLRKED